jgi:hypothetical protein
MRRNECPPSRKYMAGTTIAYNSQSVNAATSASTNQMCAGLGVMRVLTFDMSGGAKGAKRPLGRPLDGGVRRLVEGLCIAIAARKCLAESLGPTFWRNYPGTLGPWRIVANVLVVTALEFGHPMVLFVLVEAHDSFGTW